MATIKQKPMSALWGAVGLALLGSAFAPWASADASDARPGALLSPVQQAAVAQLADAYESVLAVDRSDAAAVRAVNGALGRAQACVYHVWDDSHYKPGEVSLEIERLVIQSPQARRRFAAFNAALDGAAWTLPAGESACDPVI